MQSVASSSRRRLNAFPRLLTRLTGVLIVLLVLPGAFAQETTAGVQGIVKDSSGAVIAKATVEIASPAMIGTRRIQTDGAGNYRFAALPPGTYTITVTAVGFRTSRAAGIDLSA